MDPCAIRRLAIAGALAALAAGCAVPQPPDPQQLRAEALPNTKLPERFVAAPTDSGDVVNGWLALFGDPALDKLVAEAMAYNTDLRVAAARVEAAEASARAAGAALYPQLNVLGKGGGKMGGDSSGLNLFGLFASWELDLWGRVRSERAAAGAQYEATVLDQQYARNSVAALVAKSWFLAREATAQRAIATEMVQSSQGLAGLARDRLRVGKGDEFDVVQADASVLSYRDLALQADRARQEALRAVEILAGRYPAADLDAGMDLPRPPSVPVGLPSQLLERRPDVRAAERRVAAAYARRGEAEAARLPRISLTASVNTVSSTCDSYCAVAAARCARTRPHRSSSQLANRPMPCTPLPSPPSLPPPWPARFTCGYRAAPAARALASAASTRAAAICRSEL